MVAPNEHQIQDVYALAKELGVDEVAFKTAQVYDYENGNRLIPKTAATHATHREKMENGLSETGY